MGFSPANRERIDAPPSRRSEWTFHRGRLPSVPSQAPCFLLDKHQLGGGLPGLLRPARTWTRRAAEELFQQVVPQRWSWTESRLSGAGKQVKFSRLRKIPEAGEWPNEAAYGVPAGGAGTNEKSSSMAEGSGTKEKSSAAISARAGSGAGTGRMLEAAGRTPAPLACGLRGM